MKISCGKMALLSALLPCVAATTAVAGSLEDSLKADSRSEIYGPKDDRLNLSDLSSDDAKDIDPALLAKLRTAADSVAALFKSDQVSGGNLTLYPYTEKLHNKYQLCKDVRFREEKTGSFCSGSLIGPNLILTAGHCVLDQDECDSTKVVFGWEIKEKNGATPAAVNESDVYSCKKVLRAFYLDMMPENPKDKDKLDYSVIVLDREVKDRKPLVLNRKGNIKPGTKLAVIGHPAGLAKKIIPAGKVRSTASKIYFTTDLDTFVGNSGSPVFNINTMQVEGALVRGGTDYVVITPAANVEAVKQDWIVQRYGYDVEASTGSETCIKYHNSPQEGGRGEDVTRASVIARLVSRAISEENKKKVKVPQTGKKAGKALSEGMKSLQ